jgi:hypothetical protein
VTALGMVEHVDELENILLGLLARRVRMVIDAFGLECVKKSPPRRCPSSCLCGSCSMQCHVR